MRTLTPLRTKVLRSRRAKLKSLEPTKRAPTATRPSCTACGTRWRRPIAESMVNEAFADASISVLCRAMMVMMMAKLKS